MSERKYAIEASEDGRFLVEPFIFNDMNFHLVNSQRENERFQRDLKVKDDEINWLKQENERLYKIISNLTSEK